jgi:DNA modification methylase
MEIKCAHTRVADIETLVPNPKNPNKHPENQIKLLAKIMSHQGWRNPVVVSKRSGFVIKGHGRLMAARLNGWEKIPVDEQEYANEADEYADMVADNKIAELADSDLSMINRDVMDFGPDFDLDLLGIPNFVVEPLDKLDPQCDEDEVPETPAEPKTKPGDIYQLGRHRLMCGDSTSIDAVERLMAGERAGMTFTSPPYNAARDSFLNGRVGGFDKKYTTHSDDLTDEGYLSLLRDFTAVCLGVSDFVFVNLQILAHNRIPLVEYQHHYREQLKDILIWNKKICPPNIVKGAFNTKWEYVFCFAKDVKTRGFPVDWQGQYPNVVETESNSGNEFADVHKAGFPVAFPLWFLEKLPLGDVLDPFGGTGTTLIACEKTNRRCFMAEIDPHYVDVIVSRYCRYVGAKKVIRNGEEIEWMT